MKFTQLPIGARFKWRGLTYSKSGPLVATNEAAGSRQLMMRSAEVTPLPVQRSDDELPSALAESVPVSLVKAAFQDFYQVCEALLQEADRQPATAVGGEFRPRLKAARQRFLEQING